MSKSACAVCGSRDTQVGFDEVTCLRPGCGRLTKADGTAVPYEVQYGFPEATPGAEAGPTE